MCSTICFSHSFLIFALLLCSSAKVAHVVEGRKGIFVNLHSLVASDTCFVPPGSNNNSLLISHPYGPACSPLRGNATSNNTVDGRLGWAKRRSLSTSSNGGEMQLSSANKASVTTWGALPGGLAVKVGFGTPQVKQTLLVTLNYDMNWIRCQPCLYTCAVQDDPIFEPYKSSTYKRVSCDDSTACNDAAKMKCASTLCQYKYTYREAGFISSTGYLSRETLTLTPTDVFQDFVFGCDYNSTGLTELDFRVAGILGLGRGSTSFITQTSKKYGMKFSYCLPKTFGSTGLLNFGPPDHQNNNTRYTPLVTNPGESASWYTVEMLGVGVQGKLMEVDPTMFNLTVVEWDFLVTALPRPAYVALREAFRSGMTNYELLGPFRDFDTCYNTTGLRTMVVPSVEMHFRDMTLQLSGKQIISVVDTSRACLAFIPTPGDQSTAIIGYTQQIGVKVVIDLPGNRIGFEQGAC